MVSVEINIKALSWVSAETKHPTRLLFERLLAK